MGEISRYPLNPKSWQKNPRHGKWVGECFRKLERVGFAMSENIGFGVKGIGEGVRGHVYLGQQLAIGDTTTVAMAHPNYEFPPWGVHGQTRMWPNIAHLDIRVTVVGGE